MAALLHWFRTDLRLHGNPALQASLARAEREGQARGVLGGWALFGRIALGYPARGGTPPSLSEPSVG